MVTNICGYRNTSKLKNINNLNTDDEVNEKK